MKRFKMIFALFMFFVFMGNAMATERLGPESITDHYLETAISGYIHSTSNSNDNNTTGLAAMGSIWYVKHDIDIGVEVLLSEASGLFVSGRYPVDNQWNIAAGIGQIGYAVKTPFGDYYAKPLAVMVAGNYQTGYGKFIGRLILSESNKDYLSTSEICDHDGRPDPDRDNCRIIYSNNETENTRHIIMLGFQRKL